MLVSFLALRSGSAFPQFRPDLGQPYECGSGSTTLTYDSLYIYFLTDFVGLSTEDPNCVVVGLAPSHFHYERINQAFRQANQAKKLTNSLISFVLKCNIFQLKPWRSVPDPWRFDTDHDSRIHIIRLRILMFSSVAIKMRTKISI
jgi:hypothetical protein